MNKQQGFTLVEVLITVTMLAIIASIAAPSFSEALARQRLERSSRELALTLDHARTKAVLERREVTVKLLASGTKSADEDDKLYWIPTGQIEQKTSVTDVVFGSTGLVIQATKGKVITTDLKIRLCSMSNNKSKIITVDRMGNISQSAIKVGCSA